MLHRMLNTLNTNTLNALLRLSQLCPEHLVLSLRLHAQAILEPEAIL